jgi:hypothetical protein
MAGQFFSPTNRYCEMLRSASESATDAKIGWFPEIELCVPPVDLLTSRRSVHDFYSFAQSHVVVWMSPQAFITTMMSRNNHNLSEPLLPDTYSEPLLPDTYMHPQMHHVLTIGNRSSFSVFASEYAPGIAACDFLLSFLAKSKVPIVSLHCSESTLPVTAQVLSQFLSQSTLAKLELYNVDLDDNFGHALILRGISSSTNFNLTLECCNSAGQGEALAILIQGLQSITGSARGKRLLD